jgi:pSer/pThr/pTyr-binding forkhead associated (FHA) protein
MTDALAALRTEAPTQETGPFPSLSERAGLQAAAIAAHPAPGRYLATEERGELVLYALGDRDGQSLHIGRSPVSDILLEDPSVSRRHAVVTHRGGRTVLLDDRSLNGIYVNGQRVAEATLADGDWIGIGHVSLRYVEVTGG